MKQLSLPRIEAERIVRGMSKEDLAEALSVSKRTIQNWQNGSTEMPLSKLVFLSRKWDRTIDYLLGLDHASNESA